MRRLRLRMSIALIGCALPAAAGAWQTHVCDGDLVRWPSAGPVMMELEARWGAPGTSWGDALRRGMVAWNNGGAARRMFRWRDRRMDRIRRGNGLNEITVVEPASIDGAYGLTLNRHWACWGAPWPRADGRIIESDVMISKYAAGRGHFTGPVPNCDLHPDGDLRVDGFDVDQARAYGSTREATIIHEFGHAIGLLHEDDAMALMMRTKGEGRYCGSPQFAPHPDDLAGMRALYGAGRLDDLAASSFRYVPNAFEYPPDGPRRRISHLGVGMLDRNRTLRLCPGELVSIGWAAANRGTGDAAFDVWWFASQGPGFNRDDDVLLGIDRGRWLPAETYAGDGRRTVRVSRHMAPEVAHYVGFMLAPTGRPDSNFGNNLSYSATRLVRRPDGECR